MRNTLSPSRMNAFVPGHSSTPKSVSVPGVPGHRQLGLQALDVLCAAREANASVVSRAFRWATWATWSARKEQPRQACSGQPNTSGSKKAR